MQKSKEIVQKLTRDHSIWVSARHSFMCLSTSFMWTTRELVQSDCSIMPRAPITKKMVILEYLMKGQKVSLILNKELSFLQREFLLFFFPSRNICENQREHRHINRAWGKEKGKKILELTGKIGIQYSIDRFVEHSNLPGKLLVLNGFSWKMA